MKTELIQYLNELLKTHYRNDSKIKSTEILESKLFRVIFLLKLEGTKNQDDLVLHFRQRSNQERNEMNAMIQASANGVKVPDLIYYELANDNPFGTSFFLQRFADGEKLSDKNILLKGGLPIFLENFLNLHGIAGVGSVTPDLHKLEKYQTECLQKLRSQGQIDVERLETFFHRLFELSSAINFSKIKPSLLHGDLHYTNIIVSNDNSCHLIDWENASGGDCCQDLAYFKARTLDLLFPNEDSEESNSLFDSILTQYQLKFNADDFLQRMRFFLLAQYLEVIWRSCFPKTVEKWLRFYIDKLYKCKLVNI